MSRFHLLLTTAFYPVKPNLFAITNAKVGAFFSGAGGRQALSNYRATLTNFSP